MYILERDDDDTCMSGNAGCTPAYAVMGPTPSEKDDPPSQPSKFDKAGPARFIGIGMVAGMAFLILVAYLAFGRWPRKMRKKFCLGSREGSGEEGSVEEGKGGTKPVAVILESASTSSSEEMTHHRPPRRMSDDKTRDVERRSKSRKQSSSRRHRHRHRRSLYEEGADKGALQEGKVIDVEPGALVTGWQVEQIRAVRYEVHTPTDLQPELRQQVHIQKPCLAHVSDNNR